MSQKASTETLESIRAKHDVRGAVYFFRSAATGLTKIGQSARPGQRFQEIGAHLPDLECVGCVCTDEPRWLERLFHGLFRSQRKHGEWFALDADDLAVIDSLPDYLSDLEDLPLAFRLHLSVVSDDSPLAEASPRAARLLDIFLRLAVDEAEDCSTRRAAVDHLTPLLERECERLLASRDEQTQQLVRRVIAALPAES
jgi:hypothetical protein